MIANARPLQPEFAPREVVHRDGDIDVLIRTLEPLSEGHYAEPAILYGPAGTGKTCIARYAVEQLRERVGDLRTQYINCWEDPTRFKTLYRALEGLDSSLDVHRQSTPRDELTDRLRDATDQPYVLVLDEVDQLEEKDVLYDLARTPDLSLIAIAHNDEDLFEGLEERVASRFQTATRIHLHPYDTDELHTILQDRVRWSLRQDAVTSDRLRQIADAANGDARVAIGSLRAAAEQADSRGLDELTEEIVHETTPEDKVKMRRENPEQLSDDQRLIYDIISEQEGIQPGTLYEAYCERAENPRTHRTVRNYLKKMRQRNLIVAEGRGKAREYRLLE